MAKVTDIQDKNGVSKEIQDKDLANRTSQSTVASTDYILLEDTDGAYHKIAKASFTEAVRGALGSVINSVAKGTDIAKVPVLDSNNDLGMGTLANLASVLGGELGYLGVVGGVNQSNPTYNIGCIGLFAIGHIGNGYGIYQYYVNGSPSFICGTDHVANGKVSLSVENNRPKIQYLSGGVTWMVYIILNAA